MNAVMVKKSLGLRKRDYRNRHGRCYELAYHYLMDSVDETQWTLVHGEVNLRTGRMSHAWLEKDGLIYDVVLNQFYDVEKYARLFDAVAHMRYTKQEAAKQVSESNHSGPWE